MHAAPSRSVFQTYVHNIEVAYHSGQATEHSYRADLKQLIERLSPGIVALNEPKRVACGAPDFVISRKQTPLGSIETKDIDVSLDRIERSDQMHRYLGSQANLILTDYLELRWYVVGQPRITTHMRCKCGCRCLTNGYTSVWSCKVVLLCTCIDFTGLSLGKNNGY